MQRYWAALRQAAEATGIQVDATLEQPAIPVTASGRFTRAYQNYWAYPRHCRNVLEKSGSRLAHILDHSFAHILKVIPHNCKTVVTVHDLIPFRDTEGMTNAQLKRFRNKMELLQKADKLVAVSVSTRNDLVEFLGIPEGQIAVVPNGVSWNEDCTNDKAEEKGILEVLKKDAEGNMFTVLSIGSSVPRKNLDQLPGIVSAFSQEGGGELRLVRVGDPLSDELRQRLEGELGAAGVIELGRVSDTVLSVVYEQVDALIFPSTYEGFGLPVLEAMSAGCPVVASDIPSHREVGGECVSFFPADDPQRGGKALADLARAGESVNGRIEAGIARAKEFTWERHLAGLLEVYDGVLGVEGSD